MNEYLDYEYITQVESAWEDAPSDAVKIAIWVMQHIWDFPITSEQGHPLLMMAVDILNTWANIRKLWDVLPVVSMRLLYKQNYGDEWEAFYEQDKPDKHNEQK